MTTPLLQALLLADHVYVDRTTGKHIICGVFSRIQVIPHGNKPPDSDQPVSVAQLVRAGSPFAYLSLTEVRGSRLFELRFVALSDNSVLFSTQFRIDSKDPVATIELALPLPAIKVPKAGTYALELLCNDTLLGSHRVEAVLQPGVNQP